MRILACGNAKHSIRSKLAAASCSKPKVSIHHLAATIYGENAPHRITFFQCEFSIRQLKSQLFMTQVYIHLNCHTISNMSINNETMKDKDENPFFLKHEIK